MYLGNINVKGVDNMNNENIKNLNSILEGEYMAVNSLDSVIAHAKDENTKNELQKIQQIHRQHASQIATRIQDLGGNPPDSVGIQGVIAETISNIKHIGTTDTTTYLKEALQGENMGIKTVNEVLASNNDPNSAQLLGNFLNEYQTNINSLNNLINTSNSTE